MSNINRTSNGTATEEFFENLLGKRRKRKAISNNTTKKMSHTHKYKCRFYLLTISFTPTNQIWIVGAGIAKNHHSGTFRAVSSHCALLPLRNINSIAYNNSNTNKRTITETDENSVYYFKE